MYMSVWLHVLAVLCPWNKSPLDGRLSGSRIQSGHLDKNALLSILFLNYPPFLLVDKELIRNIETQCVNENSSNRVTRSCSRLY